MKWLKTKIDNKKNRYAIEDDGYAVAEVVGETTANLIAAAPEMLELLKDILGEVRPEISRVNEAAGQTIFNPVATETIDMAKELIAKAEAKLDPVTKTIRERQSRR